MGVGHAFKSHAWSLWEIIPINPTFDTIEIVDSLDPKPDLNIVSRQIIQIEKNYFGLKY